ncbi:OadG family protein [Halomonas nitroreducens]|uniref:Probable oxaloacetate decarboxylase gamma chain n=2 Tax=Halomonas nitroreducens TaxID=447425 RepID=A0A3S0HQE2_9GAMM|nr:OadG family transporter subunit [Halomonas nitroreducens]RTQ97110.1 sodium pump decarboxylase subunit gamma [Halomonas nitroreducens]
MQDMQLLNEGFALMGLGMGFVFVFLTVLVIVTTLMSKVIGRFFPEPAPAAPSRPGRAAPAGDDELMAVISAAVHRYRQRHRR